MSVRLTGGEVLRWAIRISNQRLPWQHHAPRMLRMSPLLVKDKFDTGLSHIWSTGKGPPAGNPVNIVRYYCQGRTHDKQIRMAYIDQLQQYGSIIDTLDMVCQSSQEGDHLTVSESLSHIWNITKRMSNKQREYEMVLMFQHAGFQSLLQRTMQVAGRLASRDLAYSLNAIVNLGVSPRSQVVQTLLRFSQERLNEFHEKALSVLAHCLESMESGPNVDALKDGLSLVIESRYPAFQDLASLQNCMRHVGKHAPLDLKRKLARKALSMTDQLSFPSACHMLTTLAMMDFNSWRLLKICGEIIAENINVIPYNRLFLVLKSYRDLGYKDPALFIAISEYLAFTIDMWDNKQLLRILYVFENMAFSPTSLMDVFLQRVMQNPDVLALKDILSILNIYSSLNHDLKDHRQQFLDIITSMLQPYLPKMSASELLAAVSCLCVLGHFPPAPLEQLLQSQNLEELSVTGEKTKMGMLQIVDLCLRLDQPDVPQLMAVPPSDLGPELKNVNLRLSSALHSIMGDTGVLQEDVLLENHYFVDAIITRHLQVTEGTTLSERESVPPEHTERIAVICPPQMDFCVGSPRPRGKLAVKLRHLKILGYTPVLVGNLDTLSDLRAKISEHQSRNTELCPE